MSKTTNTNTPEQSGIPEEFLNWIKGPMMDDHEFTNEGQKKFAAIGALAAYRHLRSQPILYLRWVKIGDKLPSIEDSYHVKTSFGFKESCYFYPHLAEWHGDLRGESDEPETVIEWLEESLLPVQPEPEIPKDFEIWLEEQANEKYYCGGDLPDSVIYEAAAANDAYKVGVRDGLAYKALNVPLTNEGNKRGQPSIEPSIDQKELLDLLRAQIAVYEGLVYRFKAEDRDKYLNMPSYLKSCEMLDGYPSIEPDAPIN